MLRKGPKSWEDSPSQNSEILKQWPGLVSLIPVLP